MSEDYDYHSHRDSKQAMQELEGRGINQSHHSDNDADLDRDARNHMSVSEVVKERRAGRALTRQQVNDWLHDNDSQDHNTVQEANLAEWVGEDDAMRVHAFRKHSDKWQDMLSNAQYRQKKYQRDMIMAKFARRLHNET